MNTRPRLEIPSSPLERNLNRLTVALLVLVWVLAFWGIAVLPDQIPINFDFQGKVKARGSKTTLLISPAIATVLIAAIFQLAKHPHLLNYPAKVTQQNAERMYRGGRRFLVWLNFGLAILFLVVEFSTVLAAMKEEKAKAATRPPASVGRSTHHRC